MGDYCDAVVRFHVAATATSPAGWISERGRYSRHPYRIAEPITPPVEDLPFEVSHLVIGLTTHDDAMGDQGAGGEGGGGDALLQPERLAARYKMLRSLNSLMQSAMSLVDLSLVARPGSIASLVSATR